MSDTPSRRRRSERRYSPRAVAAAKMLDAVAQREDGTRLAEVDVRGEVVDMRIVGPDNADHCHGCGRTMPRAA